MWRFLLYSFLFSNSSVWSQDLTVPQEILDELKTVVLTTEEDTFMFRVALPDNYDQSKTYKCFIGLSGGDQTIEKVNYCYAAWFRSGYFNKYITLLPLVHKETINFKDYSKEQIEDLLNAINEAYILDPKWLIAGTSDGGIAAFNFVAAFPERFEGIITAPGILNDSITPNSDWNHLKVILAYGELDDKKWIKGAKTTAKRLKKSVASVTLVKLTSQGHILPIKFNADKMYDPYFVGGK
jgi:predicted esterase